VFDVVGRRRWYYLFSALLTVPGLFFILLTPLTAGRAGLQFSIDYTGGTVWEIHFRDRTPTPAEVKQVLAEQGLPDSTVALNRINDRDYVLIRTEPIGLQEAPPPPSPSPSGSASPSALPSAGASGSPSPSPGPSESASASASASASGPAGASASPSGGASGGPHVPTQGRLGEVAAALQARFGPIDDVSQQASIGPIISQELTQQALVLIVLGSAGIMLWITFRFNDLRMGVTAIAALVHDVLVVVGTFAILGTVFGIQIDALFVTAMLTVIGFSVHDTIVVFDRIRENRIRHAGEPFGAIVNHSILQTLGRSINTSLTVVMTLLALLLFGGDGIRTFVLALLIGIVSGTYSSIFNASQLLVSWVERDERQRHETMALERAPR
jgi:preprotein translocase SecF subunit